MNKFVSTAWKEANVDNWVGYSATLGGVPSSMAQQLSTSSLFNEIPTMMTSVSLQVYRTWGSQTFMAGATAPNSVLVNVTGSSEVYHSSDLPQLYTDVGAT